MTPRQKGIATAVITALTIAGIVTLTGAVWRQKVDQGVYDAHLWADSVKAIKDSVWKAEALRAVLDAKRVSIEIKCNPYLKPSPFDHDCK